MIANIHTLEIKPLVMDCGNDEKGRYLYVSIERVRGGQSTDNTRSAINTVHIQVTVELLNEKE